MTTVLFGILAVFLVLAAAAGVYEYRLYAPAQRSEVPLLSTAYLAGMVLLGLLGLGGLAWLASGRSLSWGVTSLASFLVLGVVVAQSRMHRRLGIDGSPLVDHLLSAYRE